MGPERVNFNIFHRGMYVLTPALTPGMSHLRIWRIRQKEASFRQRESMREPDYADKGARHHMTHLCRENQATEIKDVGCAWHAVSNELAYEIRPATIALAARTGLPVASLAATSDTAAELCRREAGKSRLSDTNRVNKTARGRKRTLGTCAHVSDSRIGQRLPSFRSRRGGRRRDDGFTGAADLAANTPWLLASRMRELATATSAAPRIGPRSRSLMAGWSPARIRRPAR